MHQDQVNQKRIGKWPANSKNDAFAQSPLIGFHDNSHVIIIIDVNQLLWMLAFDRPIYSGHPSIVSTYPVSVQLSTLSLFIMLHSGTTQAYQDSDTVKLCHLCSITWAADRLAGDSGHFRVLFHTDSFHDPFHLFSLLCCQMVPISFSLLLFRFPYCLTSVFKDMYL